MGELGFDPSLSGFQARASLHPHQSPGMGEGGGGGVGHCGKPNFYSFPKGEMKVALVLAST